MRKVYAYYNGTTCPVKEFLDNAEKKIRNKFIYCLDYVKDDKHCFIEPYVKHFSGGKFSKLYELRVMALSKMVRIIFYEHDEELIFLHAFYKTALKDTKDALGVALKILDRITDKNGAVLEEFKEELILSD